ncbi:MAG: lipoprotein releasing system transrane protein LolC [Chitinophagaceae bacterium]|nr:lipoprotein releasing system transrane protein LolC [Chitinophagaceae bacterium]
MYLLFAWRYFKSKKSINAINIIAWISVLAIAVGTAALIIVLSVFNGFEGLVKSLYGDFYADVKVVSVSGKYFHFTDADKKKLFQVNSITGISRVIEEKALLANGDYQAIPYIKGVDTSYIRINNIDRHLEKGKYELGTTDAPKLVLGSGIANAIGANPGLNLEQLTIYLPNRDAHGTSIDQAMLSYNATTAGSFTIQQEFDNKYAFTNLAFMQYMLNLQADECTALEIKTNLPDDNAITEIKKKISEVLGKNFAVQTRFEQNQSLYTVMEVEKWVVYGILCLILIVAAFNMIGALTMLVLEKQKDIAVLKAMGMNNTSVQKLFLYEGLVLAGIGGTAGLLIAVITCVLQVKYKLIKLTGGSFVIDYYPVKMLPGDFILVSATILLVTVFASWFPSRKASLQLFSLKSQN